MKLSKRLMTIANMVPNESSIVDVGCDHGLLDIYLTLVKKVNCVATDINVNCIKKTKENFEKTRLTQKIPLICTNGLDNINLDRVDYVIIAGMGTSSILKIIARANVSKCIIQANNNQYELRKKMNKMGFEIKNEVFVYEKKKYYVIIEFVKGPKKYRNYEYFFGPYILKDTNLEYKKHLYKKYSYVTKKNKKITKKIILSYYLLKLKKYC